MSRVEERPDKAGVAQANPNTSQEDSGGWEQGLCMTAWCNESVLYVQRCAGHAELWRIAIVPGQDSWLVAATRPICPFCGGTLLTSANIDP
ncbi:MAG TPA: hypothetical protein VKQ36_04135 [Ktedonobacterales bacterium]|nr:hypothetical protein [Ktedonobacterales bacterium]